MLCNIVCISRNDWSDVEVTLGRRARGHFVTLIAINVHLIRVEIDWDSATCITYSTDYYQRLTLESWFTNLKKTPLNRSQLLPAPYKRLIDEIKQN